MSGNGAKRFKEVETKVLAGERLTTEDGLTLFGVTNLPALAFLADTVRRRKRPDREVTFVIGRIFTACPVTTRATSSPERRSSRRSRNSSITAALRFSFREA